MGRFLHTYPFSSLGSLLHMDTVMLINDQSELLVEGSAEYLHGRSLDSDDNLSAKKGTLGTCLDSTFISEAYCFSFPYMFIWGHFGKTGEDYGEPPQAILWCHHCFLIMV